MNSRFVFWTDLQLAARAPRHRIDDYSSSLLAKVEHTYTIAQDFGAEFLVFGGDFFNSHRVFTYDLINSTVDIMRSSGLQTYAIIGQHDLSGYNAETFPASTLAFLCRNFPFVQIIRQPVRVGGVVLHASHVYDDVVADCDEHQRFDDGCFHILVAHHLISDREAMFDVIESRTLTPCGYDLVLSGDLHCGFEAHRVGKTTFANPGSVARQAISDADRWPQVALVEVADGACEVRYERLNAKPGEEVFEVSAAEGREPIVLDVSKFVSEVRSVQDEAVDVFDLVRRVGADQKLRKPVLDYILRKRDEIECKDE